MKNLPAIYSAGAVRQGWLRSFIRIKGPLHVNKDDLDLSKVRTIELPKKRTYRGIQLRLDTYLLVFIQHCQFNLWNYSMISIFMNEEQSPDDVTIFGNCPQKHCSAGSY